ncbi:MAG: decarboxylating NADP(+)-dependent phosphogluconate dehydrogenase [Candidatus Latescibacterota bacterium]
MSHADIGLVGLAVMGENLVLNMASHGFTVAVYNRTTARVDEFVAGRARGQSVIGARSPEELVSCLQRPRRVMLMVRAGPAVDACLAQLSPLLEPGDIVIDGGNSHFADTTRRTRELAGRGLLFVGTGVSGGEEGALRGPSIMPGGNPAAWPHVRPILQAIAARVADGTPCCDWVGPDGAGHFVKMVHNGIEYGDMQLICEAYALLRQLLGLQPEECGAVFAAWDQGELDSYLVEITGQILSRRDPETGQPMVDVILDSAGQKGTGKWTASEALQLGMPTTTITEAVFARFLSSLKDEREAASRLLPGPGAGGPAGPSLSTEDIRQALYAAKICSYTQGFQLLRAADREHGWTLDYGGIALLWREGCIIRAQFLSHIKEAFGARPDLPNLLLSPYFRQAVERAQSGWRRAVAAAVTAGIPVPAFASALAYYDGYRSARLPAALLQAQRDYFGAHTYERVDRPPGEHFHTDWTGAGGATASTSYSA